MLIKVRHLKGIKAGDYSLAFRKWKRPGVKMGTILNTPVGQIEVAGISETDISSVSGEDALLAGYGGLEELMNEIRSRKDGTLYRIQLKYRGTDPRLELRDQTDLSEDDINEITGQLEKYDRFSRQGSWTAQTLKAIKDHPKLRAADLASKTGFEKDWLKTNIRKLKNLGLTISHEAGYSLSPRGWSVLKFIKDK